MEELPPALSVVVSVEELFHKASRSALAAVSPAAVGCGSTGGLKLSAQAMRRSPSNGARCGARHVDNGHTSPSSSRTPGATCSPGGAVVSAATSKTGAVSVSSTGATTGGGAHSKLVGGGAHPLPTQPGSRLHTSISIHLPHVAISRELDEDALCRGIILC